jgi:predicted O-methyltransferase YrrM
VAHHLFRIKSYLSYWLNAVDEHSLHSPFLFDFYTTVLKPRVKPGDFNHIEKLRRQLLHDKRAIAVSDLGAKRKQKALRKISFIARTSLSTPRFSSFYFRIANYFKANTIVELGTSFGINALYLAEKKDATITTFEGSPSIASIAALTFEFVSKKNVAMISGDIDVMLPSYLQHIKKVDLAFIDANHRYEPTLKYFQWLLKKIHERSVLIVDDIHYSPEMENAWKMIKNHRLVYASADLFRCGIVFFDPSLNKQHVILQV